ncbi:ATP-binding protein [Variovorax sp. PvP013]|uniref:ATP-binding protein n=1 Tax=Variovorax sp. PvP013 TaxID=3156435 RepID=UPI003D1E8440
MTIAPPAMAATTADLTACDLEPIRVPGAIQPHGRMLVLAADAAPLAHSANWPADALREAWTVVPSDALASLVDGQAPVALEDVRVGGVAWALSGHRCGEHLILEFEDAPPAPPQAQAPIHSLTRVFLPRLQEAGSLDALTALVAAEMKRLSGFGRCLVYRFDAAGHGEVLAERIDPGYTSYAGHHFPAGDIPKQARELYVLNPFRLIADATYDPVPLVAADARAADPVAPPRIDLSQAQLRSVSPVHLEYMRNMGTLASMSVSIVIGGRLWGLVSCHDHHPRRLAPPTRLACEHLGQLLALQIQAVEANRAVAERLDLRQLTLEIVARLADSDATLARLVEHPGPMLALAGATGAAVVLDDRIWTVGEVPAHDDVRPLADWIWGLGREVFETASLAAHHATGHDLRHVAAGVLAISISQVHRHLVLWFRPEILQTVTWAGDPRKAHASADGRIHPRRSFESWVETIRDRATPWTPAQVGAAGELRQALIGIVLRRAEEMAQVAAELGRVNKELEAFSYTVSHDLRAPMRHIAGYVDLVVESEGDRLGERTLRYLAHAKEAAAFAGQLVDGLLDFSRMGRAALKVRAIDTGALVEELVGELVRLEPGREIVWSVAPDLPVLQADALLLQVAVRNLLGNAVKYTRGRRPAHIAVRAVRRDDGEGLEVEDDGVGFQMKYAGKLFGVFQRLHAAEEFEGTGIGLANVRRIVERHGGSVWARGEIRQGACFGFVLPRRTPADGPSAEAGEPHA